jgi:Family of unknown function (DUF6541)
VRIRLPAMLLAAPLLGVAWLLPGYGFGLWLRLLAASLVLLLPGRLVARALGLRGAVAALAWSTALVAGALAVTFAVGASLDLTLALVLAAGAAMLVLRPTVGDSAPRGRGLVLLGGLALGGAIWFVESVLNGDALFHLGRIRKLDDLGSLSLHAVGEFRNGGLHPGYAFPLWHGWLALVARLGGVDPTKVMVHESSILVAVAVLVALEAGIAVFESLALGLTTMVAQVAIFALAPGHGGAYTMLTQPGTAARQLFVPAAIALFFRFVRTPSRALGVTLAATALDLSFIHPTYALFLAIPLVAFVAARALLARGADLRAGVVALVAYGLPMGSVFLWLKPIVDQTVGISPGSNALAASLKHYRGDLVVDSLSRYHLASEVVARTGAVTVASLVLVPLALLARRRRWSALVLGATVVVLALSLWSLVFPHFSNAVSLSQARRASGFVPFAFAFAGGAAVLARLPRPPLLALALGTGIWLQIAYPGDFGLRTPHNGPGLTAWIALYGGLAALAAGTVLAWIGRGGAQASGRREWTALLAAAAFAIPVAVHGFSQWSPRTQRDAYALTPGLVHFLQTSVRPRALVFGDLETSYRVTAFAPVYVVAEPPAHVAHTTANRIHKRRAAVLRFFEHHDDLEIPRAWSAGWLVLRRGEGVDAVEAQGLKPVYADDRYVVFDLRPAD